jgi:N-acetylglucosamine-6-sulfatase
MRGRATQGRRHRPRARAAASTVAATALALLAGALAVLGGPAAQGPAAAAVESPPNVVIVLTDDQRVRTTRRMPKLWSLVRERGVEYTQAATPTSLCCPSRASILTGLFAHSTGVYSNGLPYGGWETFRDRGMEQRTLATALQAAGYHTALVGKYMNGGFPAAAAEGYRPPGWDEVVTFTSGHGHYDYSLTDGRYYGTSPADYSTDVLAGHAVDAVSTAPAGKPLFLYFATTSPHRPFLPAPRHQGVLAGQIPSYSPRSVDEDVSDKPGWVRRYPPWPQERIDADVVGMQEMLLSVDDAVGAIISALEVTGRMDNTLFVFLSDNGLMLGEHHLLEWKNVPYKWSTSIPLLMRWDGHITPGSTDDRLALNVDLATTIGNATGVPMQTEGLDLLGATSRSGFPLEATRRFRFDSLPRHPAYCGYRTRRWMFVQYNNGFRELYDYVNDPQELRNRAYGRRYQDKVRSLRTMAKSTCFPVPPEFSW